MVSSNKKYINDKTAEQQQFIAKALSDNLKNISDQKNEIQELKEEVKELRKFINKYKLP